MHIVFDYQIFTLQQFGGISRYFVELAARLPAWSGDMETSIVAPLYINEYLDPTTARLTGRKIPPFPGKHRILPAINRFASGNILRSLRPDIIHETYYSSRGIAYACPRILTVYDMLHERYPDLFTGADRQVSRLKAKAARRADHIITISEITRDDLRKFLDVDEEKITVVPLAASLKKGAEKYRGNERPYVLYVGLREGVKNFSGLLPAFADSAVLCRDFDLLCVGGGSFSPQELRRLSSLGIKGNVSQLDADDGLLASLYAGAAMFIYPSLYEGFGIPLLEAMRCGCPVACSNTSSMPSVAGDAAVFFDPSDPGDMRRAMERIVQSDEVARDLRMKGHARERKFSWDKCVGQTAAVYRRFAKS